MQAHKTLAKLVGALERMLTHGVVSLWVKGQGLGVPTLFKTTRGLS